jgi:hypothetical protein
MCSVIFVAMLCGEKVALYIRKKFYEEKFQNSKLLLTYFEE